MAKRSSKKDGNPSGKSTLLTHTQIETLVDSITRSRFVSQGKQPSDKDVQTILDWASTTIADHTLLKAVLMGGLDINVEDGEVSFVPGLRLQGMLGELIEEPGKLH